MSSRSSPTSAILNPVWTPGAGFGDELPVAATTGRLLTITVVVAMLVAWGTDGRGNLHVQARAKPCQPAAAPSLLREPSVGIWY